MIVLTFRLYGTTVYNVRDVKDVSLLTLFPFIG